METPHVQGLPRSVRVTMATRSSLASENSHLNFCVEGPVWEGGRKMDDSDGEEGSVGMQGGGMTERNELQSRMEADCT